jgi:hypothetical protein
MKYYPPAVTAFLVLLSACGRSDNSDKPEERLPKLPLEENKHFNAHQLALINSSRVFTVKVEGQTYKLDCRWITKNQTYTHQRMLDIYLVNLKIGAFVNTNYPVSYKGKELSPNEATAMHARILQEAKMEIQKVLSRLNLVDTIYTGNDAYDKSFESQASP